jgi:hypothetical protein
VGPKLPLHVQELIAERISSVVQLELLLLLHSEPTRAWTSAELATLLRIDPAGADVQLADLTIHKILRSEPGSPLTYQYISGNPYDSAIAELSRTYNDMRVSVIGLIYSKPSDTLKTFADAFRIRKEKD